MDKLTITKQSLGKRATTAIHLDIDTFLKVEKISMITGKRKNEILAEMVDFSLQHAEVENCKKSDIAVNLKVNVADTCDTSTDESDDIPVTSDKIYVSIAEASKITGLSTLYLRTNIKAGNIPYLTSGNKFLVNIKKLIALLDEVSMKGETNDVCD